MSEQKTFTEKLTCQNPEDADDIKGNIREILEIDTQAADLKERKKALVQDLIALDTTIKWDIGPNLSCRIKKKKIFACEPDKIIEFFGGMAVPLRRLLSTNWFKKGAMKGDERLAEFWTETETDVFEFNKYDPEFVENYVFNKKKEDEYLAQKNA